MMLALVACAGTGGHGKFTAPAGSAEAEAWQLGNKCIQIQTSQPGPKWGAGCCSTGAA